MAILTTVEQERLMLAKQNCNKYQYGSLYYKQARKRYDALVRQLSEKYHCSSSDITQTEKRNF